jgi:hypothetical protein
LLAGLWRSEPNPEAAIDAIAARDPIAGLHIRDIFDLCIRGLPARLASDPDSARIMPILAKLARACDPEAHVVAGDFRSSSPAERITSHSVRVVRGPDDLIIGPHLRYSTLVQALEIALQPRSNEADAETQADAVR